MKDLDALKTGGKPAPGELIIVQGFVNTLDVESGVDGIGTRQLLRAWLVRHGLLRTTERVSAKDHRTVLSFREALRQLLLANNGEAIQSTSLSLLNELASRYPLGLVFRADGTFSLSPTSQGIAGALGQIFAQMVRAVGEQTWSRLKACSEPNCQWAFYDGSKNHSGRWCSMSVCGSREKARSYRKRRADKK